MRNNLVGFTGAGGTGKSSTAEFIGTHVPSLVSKLRHLIYGKESKYGDLKGAEFLSFQCLILTLQIHEELRVAQKYQHNNIIIPVERSAIDYAAYTLHMDDILFKDRINSYVNNCIDYTNKTYKGLVYFPIKVFDFKLDLRPDKENDQESIEITDQHIQELLKKVKIPILHLTTKTVQDRADEIIDFFKYL